TGVRDPRHPGAGGRRVAGVGHDGSISAVGSVGSTDAVSVTVWSQAAVGRPVMTCPLEVADLMREGVAAWPAGDGHRGEGRGCCGTDAGCLATEVLAVAAHENHEVGLVLVALAMDAVHVAIVLFAEPYQVLGEAFVTADSFRTGRVEFRIGRPANLGQFQPDLDVAALVALVGFGNDGLGPALDAADALRCGFGEHRRHPDIDHGFIVAGDAAASGHRGDRQGFTVQVVRRHARLVHFDDRVLAVADWLDGEQLAIDPDAAG